MNTTIIIHPNVNELIEQANKAKFEEYLDVSEYGEYRHLIMTCLKGKFDGDVIDIYYTDLGVFNIEYSNQNRDTQPTFKYNITLPKVP